MLLFAHAHAHTHSHRHVTEREREASRLLHACPSAHFLCLLSASVTNKLSDEDRKRRSTGVELQRFRHEVILMLLEVERVKDMSRIELRHRDHERRGDGYSTVTQLKPL